MKLFSSIFVAAFLLVSCNNNVNYQKNLATAQKTFSLFESENLEEQMEYFSEDLVYSPPSYEMSPMGKNEFQELLKIYHSSFEALKYTPDVWLPGTDDNGILDGSVRTYGTWNSVDSNTGKKPNLLEPIIFSTSTIMEKLLPKEIFLMLQD